MSHGKRRVSIRITFSELALVCDVEQRDAAVLITMVVAAGMSILRRCEQRGTTVEQVRARKSDEPVDRAGAGLDVLQPFVDAGILVIDGDRWRLTREGCLVAHEVMTVFV